MMINHQTSGSGVRGKCASTTSSGLEAASGASAASIDSWFACGISEGEEEEGERDYVGGGALGHHHNNTNSRDDAHGVQTKMMTTVDEDDDPLASLLNMSHEESAFLLNGEGAASISAALDALANELKAVSANDVAAKAYVAPHSKTIKPSPLGNGVPALQQQQPAHAASTSSIPPPVKFTAAAELYTGGLPQRVVSKERQAQLDRYRAKRERRLAGIKNKVRYECRKTLAAARTRVGGRFVKISAEEKRLKSVQSCPDLSALTDMRSLSSSDVDMTDSAKDLTAPPVFARHKDDKLIGRLSMSSDDDNVVSTKSKRMSEDNVRPRLSNNPTDALPRLSSSDVSTEDELGDFTSVKRINEFGLPVSSTAMRGLQRSSELRHCQSEICLAALVGV
jgi:hypothetical protein